MKKISFWTRSLLLLCFIVFCSSNGWADNAIYGSWSNYNTKEVFSENKVSVTLAADTDYWFYFWDSNNSTAKFCNSGTMNFTNCSGWKFTSSETTYCGIHTNAAGTYVFSVDWKDESGTWYPYLSVTYPSSTTETYNIVIDGTEQTQNATGSFVVDLTSAASDSQVYFKINNEDYKLATAASITTNGTTNYTAGTSGTANLTLTKGLMYYFTVKSDGSVTVKAVNPDVTVENENSYYLIGNFMNTDGDNINMTNLIFRFNQTGANTYAFDVPATLEVMSQIYSISAEGVKTIYGPTSNTVFNISNNSSADYGLAAYDIAANSNYFIAHDRTLDSDGMYTYTLTVNDEGIPTSVNVKHTQLTRVAYFLPDATDATAQPAYSTRNNASSAGNNKYFGSVNLQENQKCFVISNIRQQADDTYHHGLRFTQNKLYRQGNGGGDVISGGSVGSIDYHKVYPKWADKDKTVPADGFTFGGQAGAYTLEYNPSVGINDVVNVSENALIGGEVKKAGFGDLPDVINSINIVGTGITGSFKLNTKVPMTYNQTLKCYEYTFDSSSAESGTNLFRFVANDTWAINWGEESTSAADHAKVPYQGSGLGHTAMPDDPNVLKQYDSWTEGTGLDIIFNRPAGHWTIRFYIVTESASGGNGYTNKYYYTINGSPLSPYDVPIYGGRVLCSFSSNKDLEIPTGYRAYVAHSFTQKQEGSNNTQDGTVKLYRIKYIPANVGVILYGNNVAINGTTVTVPFLDYIGDQLTGENLWYNTHDGEQFNNYLVAAPDGCTLSDNGELDPEWLKKGKYDYLARYFAFTWFSKTKNGKLYTWTEPANDAPKQGTLDSDAATAAGLNLPADITDYASFFRAKGTVGRNRAYLRLPKEVMDYNGQALVQNQDEDGNLFAKTSLRFDDFFYEDDFNEGEVTDVNSVKNASKTTNDNVYYNLQGMKVSNPTKGLYIINGKKVIIK